MSLRAGLRLVWLKDEMHYFLTKCWNASFQHTAVCKKMRLNALRETLASFRFLYALSFLDLYSQAHNFC